LTAAARGHHRQRRVPGHEARRGRRAANRRRPRQYPSRPSG